MGQSNNNTDYSFYFFSSPEKEMSGLIEAYLQIDLTRRQKKKPKPKKIKIQQYIPLLLQIQKYTHTFS